jgi:hypothetical protein
MDFAVNEVKQQDLTSQFWGFGPLKSEDFTDKQRATSATCLSLLNKSNTCQCTISTPGDAQQLFEKKTEYLTPAHFAAHLRLITP